MDNEAYLKHIAAQTRPTPSNRLLSPTIIKLIAGALIALILIIALGIILNSANQRTITVFERYHLRLQNLSSDSGPLVTYGNTLKSSDLRSLSNTLKTSLTATSRDFSAVLADLNVDITVLSETATTEEAAVIASFEGELRDAQLNGILDRTFASSTILQISLLLSLQSEVREKSDNSALTSILDRSDNDLNTLLESFTNYSNSH